MNKFVAYGLISALTLALVNAIVIEPSNAVLADSIYSIAGLGFFLFGIWASVILLRLKK